MVYAKRYPHVRRYYRGNFVHLPDDTLLLLFQYLPAKDLCKMRRVCSRFDNLIENSSYIWLHTSFASIWPSPRNSAVFKSASRCGNLEAIIKMGISYLYNEGVSVQSSKKISPKLNEQNGKKAAKYFLRAEMITSESVSFIWSFIRPPWASGAMCCKRHVFNSLVGYCSGPESRGNSILYSLGKVLSLQNDDDDDSTAKTNIWLEKAASKGCTLSKFELWKQNQSSSNDPAVKLQQLRELRECAASNKEAALELAMNYASGNVGNIGSEMVAISVRQFLANSSVYRRRGIFQVQTDLNRTMRYILVDWLVEVSSMKHFSCHVLHAAVSYIDQFLLQRKTNRGELQLLGIGCMLIASRFYGEDIVTIRESSWLTDNTYPYEQVVRMIGEIMSCLKGETKVLTVPKYVRLFCELVKAERKVENFALYIADMSLLREHCSSYTCAIIALSCTLLGQLICYPDSIWCPSLESFLPFDKNAVLACMTFLYEKCMAEDCLVDKQNAKLKAVKERYNSSEFSDVSNIVIPCKDKMWELVQHFAQYDDVICVGDEMTSLNTTFCSIASSGYEGDDEDLKDFEESDDDEMVWFDDDDDHDVITTVAPLKEAGHEMGMLNSDQIERSTPSFLSPSWLQSVVKETANPRSRSLGSTDARAGVSRAQYHSVGGSSGLVTTPRRPLMEVNQNTEDNNNIIAGSNKSQSNSRPLYNTTQELVQDIIREHFH